MKINSKIIKIIWIALGIIILAWTAFWFVKVRILYDYGFVRNLIMFTIGAYTLVFYLMVTLIIILVKFLKKWEKKK